MIWRAPLSYGCSWEVERPLKELIEAIGESKSYAFSVLSQLNGVCQIMNHVFNITFKVKCTDLSPLITTVVLICRTFLLLFRS